MSFRPVVPEFTTYDVILWIYWAYRWKCETEHY